MPRRRSSRSIGALLGAWNASPERHAPGAAALDRARGADATTTPKDRCPASSGAARSAASVIRDRFSPDAWRAINDLASMIAAPLPIGPTESAIIERVEAALRIISSLSGLAQENMTQLAGWRFLELGRRIERALLTCRLVRCFAEAGAPDGGLDVLLELADSQISYRQRYVMIAALAPVIDLVMLDPNNPRSVGVSARPHRDASRRVAAAQCGRPPVAGAADRRFDCDAVAHRGRRQDR